MYIYIYILNQWQRDLNTDFTLSDCLFRSVKLTKNADPEKYIYTGYGIGFDLRSKFSLPDGSVEKNVIFFQYNLLSIRSSTLTAEAKYPINFTQLRKRFVLIVHYNGSNSSLFVNAAKIYQFKPKNSKLKDYTLCLGNISKDFTITNIKKQN